MGPKRSWDRLGSVLFVVLPFGIVFGPSSVLLGVIFGLLWCHFRRLGVVLGHSRGCFWTILGSFGPAVRLSLFDLCIFASRCVDDAFVI